MGQSFSSSRAPPAIDASKALECQHWRSIYAIAGMMACNSPLKSNDDLSSDDIRPLFALADAQVNHCDYLQGHKKESVFLQRKLELHCVAQAEFDLIDAKKAHPQ